MNSIKVTAVLFLVLSLLGLAFSMGCVSQCTIKNDICCNGRLQISGSACSCTVSKSAGNMMTMQQQDVFYQYTTEPKAYEAPAVFKTLASDDDDAEAQNVEEVEMALSDVPVCSFSCKQVCSDCHNDANLVHTMTAGTSDLCVTKNQIQKLDKKLQQELVKTLLTLCSQVCTRCSKLSDDAINTFKN